MLELQDKPLGRRAAGQGLATVAATLTGVAAVPRGVALAQAIALPESGPIEPAADTAPGSGPASEAEAPVSPDMSPLELLMLALVNGSRLAKEREPLQWDALMARVARDHARDMMKRGTVSHTGSDGSTPQQRLRRAGVEFRFGSENIWTYYGKVPEEGPRTMHQAMMAEPYAPGLWNHIGNILYTGYKRIGIGIVTDPRGVQYLSETFAD
jgi:uncharacterized protein YkwD